MRFESPLGTNLAPAARLIQSIKGDNGSGSVYICPIENGPGLFIYRQLQHYLVVYTILSIHSNPTPITQFFPNNELTSTNSLPNPRDSASSVPRPAVSLLRPAAAVSKARCRRKRWGKVWSPSLWQFE